MRFLKSCVVALLLLQTSGCLGGLLSKERVVVPPAIVPASVFDASPPMEAQALWRQAEIEQKAGDTDSAVATWKRIAAQYPTNAIAARASYRLGSLYLEQGKADQALKQFDHLLNNYPRWEGCTMVRVDRLRALRMKGERIEVLKQALSLWEVASDSPEIHVPLSLLIANTYKDSENMESAFEWLAVAFEKVQLQQEKESLTRDTLEILKYLDEPAVRRILARNPSELIRVFLEFRLAHIENENGNPEAARRHLARLLATNETHPLSSEMQKALTEISPAPSSPHQVRARRKYKPVEAATEALPGIEEAPGHEQAPPKEIVRSAPHDAEDSLMVLSPTKEPQEVVPADTPVSEPNTTPPQILITSHEISQALVVGPDTKKVAITGKTIDESGVAEVTVNEKEAQIREDGSFLADVYLKVGRNRIEVRAMDVHENTSRISFTILREGATVASATEPKTAAPARFAVIIGISDYQDSRIPSLRYAASDARSFYEWAISPEGGRYSPSRVKLLLDGEATGKNMKDALFVWLKQAIEEDIVTIYFAGHGSPESPDSPGNLFLLPSDAQYESIATTGFPMWDIETALQRFVKARKVVVIADACHAGGVGRAYEVSRRAIRGIEEVNPIISGLQSLSRIGDGICVISASDENQFSQESETWGGGYGVFTYFLLEGLKGAADYNEDGLVTLGELIPYLSEQVRRETRNAQCPTVAGKFDPALSIGGH